MDTIIVDDHGLIPDRSILLEVLHRHPLDPALSEKIRRVVVILSERLGFAQECIQHRPRMREAVLGIGRDTASRQDYRFLLYHEFTHIIDRTNPAFAFARSLERTLSSSEAIAVMEIWNAYIDARLHAHGLFSLSGRTVGGTYNGRLALFPTTLEGDLMSRISKLESVGAPHVAARSVIHSIWKSSVPPSSYPEMIRTTRSLLRCCPSATSHAASS